jgi:hypothetical protein
VKAATAIASGCALAAGVGAYFLLDRSPEAELREQWAFVDRYCTDCHNDAEFTGGISFQGLSPDDAHANAEVWEKAIRKLRVGMMPPRGELQPASEVRHEFVAALESTLDAAAESEPYAGMYTVHRLNRSEYANSIRDLLAIEVDVAELLPSDGASFGFDNIASVLTTSPLLLERYLTAALRVSALAVGDEEAAPTAAAYKIGVDVTQSQYVEGLPFGTRGGTLVRHYFPADAEYVLSGRLLRTVAEGYVGVEGHETPHEFIVTLDGEQVFSTHVGGLDDHELSSQDILQSRTTIDERMTAPRLSITAGPHDVGFTWIERPAADQNVWQPGLRETQEAHNPAGLPRLETAIIAGPYNPSGISDTPSRERIFTCQPSSVADEPACAEQIFSSLARRAFRRSVDADDIAAPLAFYDGAREDGNSYEQGIRAGVARMLVSPSFLFRAEREQPDRPDGGVYEVSDVELASRLSFFLWSSIPDVELLDAAIDGLLSEPSELERQVRRMLADDRATALVSNFTGQWLQLRNLEQRVIPDLLLFPDFDDNLRKAFRVETELLFSEVLRENRSVLELLSANYTYVNERLARHYTIPGIYGPRFRRVELDDPNRWGLLGHGSVLSLTSAASRTSPIIRGKYVITNFLNNPPPAPPAVVPALEDSAPKDRPSTVREQLEVHRANPECATCHNNLDPLGFALENFDAVGQWREVTREGLEIDSAGILADGTSVDGPVQLREALLADPEIFAGTVAEKLMIYALGRGLEAADMPVIREILRNTAEDNYQLGSIILGIVDSMPFQMRTKIPQPDALEQIAQTRE